jgi:hypothetical protein
MPNFITNAIGYNTSILTIFVIIKINLSPFLSISREIFELSIRIESPKIYLKK